METHFFILLIGEQSAGDLSCLFSRMQTVSHLKCTSGLHYIFCKLWPPKGFLKHLNYSFSLATVYTQLAYSISNVRYPKAWILILVIPFSTDWHSMADQYTNQTTSSTAILDPTRFNWFY